MGGCAECSISQVRDGAGASDPPPSLADHRGSAARSPRRGPLRLPHSGGSGGRSARVRTRRGLRRRERPMSAGAMQPRRLRRARAGRLRRQRPVHARRLRPGDGRLLAPVCYADLDRDGHFGVLPGKLAGEAGACGDDCDDRNAAAFPGGSEICDGADNDCNGVVDDGSSLSPSGEAVLVSEGAVVAEPSSFAFTNGGYLAAFNGEIDARNAILLVPLTRTGARAAAPTQLSAIPADVTGGSLVWIGDRLGITWSDRRDARGGILNFEVYFNLINPDRTKRMADLRLTSMDGFSLGATVAFTGTEFVVLWQDDGMNVSGIDEIHGRRLDRDGALVGGDVHLVAEGPQPQTAPALAAGRRSLGVAWVRGGATELSHRVIFAPFDFQLRRSRSHRGAERHRAARGLPDHRLQPAAVHRRLVRGSPGKAIFGAVRDELGQEIVQAKALTSGQSSRANASPSALRRSRAARVGRRSRRQRRLRALREAARSPARTTRARAAHSPRRAATASIPCSPSDPGGDVGVLFSDNRPGVPQTFFTRLVCVPAPASEVDRRTQRRAGNGRPPPQPRRVAGPAWCTLPGKDRPTMRSASLPASISLSRSSPVSMPMPCSM